MLKDLIILHLIINLELIIKNKDNLNDENYLKTSEVAQKIIENIENE